MGDTPRLFDARRDERDACGIGFVADLGNRPTPATGPLIGRAVSAVPTDGEEAERRCFRAARRATHQAAGTGLYLASCSTRTVTYKALCAADQLAAFYPDLADPALTAQFVIFHQ